MMRKNKLFPWLYVAVISLSGCATTPTPLSEAVATPPDRLLAFQSNDNVQSGELTVIRDQGHVGEYCYLGFYINGKLAARIAVKEVASFKVPAGETLLKLGWDPQGNMFCNPQDRWTQRETILKAGEKKMFRLTINSDSQALDIMRAD